MISDHAEGTFALLRYPLGGDRPSQTTHHTRSSTSFQRPKLDCQGQQGGISRSAPIYLAVYFLSLPPILHSQPQQPVQSCSKGARGLSV